eukprot:m.168964 g.168964  ORF g.168964 m.168964 type:complete len:1109 (+) comp24144_c0_seq1:131-3457(+)
MSGGGQLIVGGVVVVAAVGIASGLELLTIGLSLIVVMLGVAAVAVYDARVTAKRTQAIRSKTTRSVARSSVTRSGASRGVAPVTWGQRPTSAARLEAVNKRLSFHTPRRDESFNASRPTDGIVLTSRSSLSHVDPDGEPLRHGSISLMSLDTSHTAAPLGGSYHPTMPQPSPLGQPTFVSAYGMSSGPELPAVSEEVLTEEPNLTLMNVVPAAESTPRQDAEARPKRSKRKSRQKDASIDESVVATSSKKKARRGVGSSRRNKRKEPVPTETDVENKPRAKQGKRDLELELALETEKKRAAVLESELAESRQQARTALETSVKTQASADVDAFKSEILTTVKVATDKMVTTIEENSKPRKRRMPFQRSSHPAARAKYQLEPIVRGSRLSEPEAIRDGEIETSRAKAVLTNPPEKPLTPVKESASELDTKLPSKSFLSKAKTTGEASEARDALAKSKGGGVAFGKPPGDKPKGGISFGSNNSSDAEGSAAKPKGGIAFGKPAADKPKGSLPSFGTAPPSNGPAKGPALFKPTAKAPSAALGGEAPTSAPKPASASFLSKASSPAASTPSFSTPSQNSDPKANVTGGNSFLKGSVGASGGPAVIQQGVPTRAPTTFGNKASTPSGTAAPFGNVQREPSAEVAGPKFGTPTVTPSKSFGGTPAQTTGTKSAFGGTPAQTPSAKSGFGGNATPGGNPSASKFNGGNTAGSGGGGGGKFGGTSGAQPKSFGGAAQSGGPPGFGGGGGGGSRPASAVKSFGGGGQSGFRTPGVNKGSGAGGHSFDSNQPSGGGASAPSQFGGNTRQGGGPQGGTPSFNGGNAPGSGFGKPSTPNSSSNFGGPGRSQQQPGSFGNSKAVAAGGTPARFNGGGKFGATSRQPSGFGDNGGGGAKAPTSFGGAQQKPAAGSNRNLGAQGGSGAPKSFGNGSQPKSAGVGFGGTGNTAGPKSFNGGSQQNFGGAAGGKFGAQNGGQPAASGFGGGQSGAQKSFGSSGGGQKSFGGGTASGSQKNFGGGAAGDGQKKFGGAPGNATAAHSFGAGGGVNSSFGNASSGGSGQSFGGSGNGGGGNGGTPTFGDSDRGGGGGGGNSGGFTSGQPARRKASGRRGRARRPGPA